MAKNYLGARRNITTTALSAFFPFTSSFQRFDKSGVWLGIDSNNIPIIKDIFSIKSSTNTGVIFGIFSGNFFITILLPLLIIAFLIYEYSEDRHISYLLIIVGLFGNLLDRVVRGFVVDFIYIPVVEKYNIFLFNFADLYLVLGVILGLIYLIKKGHKK